MENEILENIIYNILGGYEPTRLIPKDTKFLLIVVDEVDFIIRILTTWPTPRDWYLTWFQEPHQKALIDSNKEFSKNEIYNRTNEIWDDMAQALTSTGTMHPRHYILPPVRIKFGKTRQDYERDRLLGWHHLGLLYPITKAKKFMKEERLRLRHEKQKARREDERYKLKYCNGIVPSTSYNSSGPSDVSYPSHSSPRSSNPSRPSNSSNIPIALTQSVYPQMLDGLDDDSSDGSHQITSTGHFPQIKTIMRELIDNLATETYDHLQHMPYRQTVNQYGPESLEGKIIDANILRAILLSQRDDDDLWAQNSGYVDIVLDDRNSEYWRAYVGQTQTPAKRIRNHVRGAMKKQPDTLHYYVIWKGCGHRSMNFLHLWTMDNMSNPFKDVFEDIEGPMFLFSNILEMSFARAFESLPIATLEMYFNKPDQPFSGLGLNILAPLMQGISATLHIRQTFALRAEKSVDPDISSWPEFRQQTREPDAIVLQWNKKLLATSWEDYIKQLGAAITRKTGFVLHIPFGMLENSWKPSSSCETWDTGIINNILEVQRGDCRLLSPFGNSKASIGILINRALIGEETDERAIPWGIRESGFNALNSLIWFWDPRCHNMRKKTEQITQAVLREHNKSFIDESNLTVILLDKSIDHYLGLQADPQIQKVEHLTYCGNLTFHIQVSLEGHGLQRIYIQSPTSFTTLFAAPGPAISRICEMFKYVAILTETKGINPYFSSTRSAIHHIIRTYCEEKKGSNKMTIETMNPIIQAWIFRKGFKEIKDLQELQKIGGGSFTTGLMLLLHTLMRMAKFVGHRPKPTANPHKRNNDPTNPVDPAAIENMIRLYKRVRGEGTANENATTASMNTAANNDKSTASDNTIKAMMNTEVIDDNAQIDDGSLGAFVSETLGPVSSQRMEDITALVSERRDEFLTRCAVEEVEWVNFETSATNLDGPLQGQESEDIEIEQNLTAIPQNNGYELIGTISEPLEPVKHSRNMIGQRNAIRQLLHSGRMYRGHWDKNRMIYQVLCTPYLANIAFLIHALRRESIPEQVLIKAYIDPGQAHPHRWATLSVPGDPGARLAFSLTMDGCTTWLSSEKVGAIRKANTFADFAMDVPIQEIATRPRRHLNVQDMGLLRACGVQELGTYFTDDKCELVRSEMSQKKPRKNVAE